MRGYMGDEGEMGCLLDAETKSSKDVDIGTGSKFQDRPKVRLLSRLEGVSMEKRGTDKWRQTDTKTNIQTHSGTA